MAGPWLQVSSLPPWLLAYPSAWTRPACPAFRSHHATGIFLCCSSKLLAGNSCCFRVQPGPQPYTSAPQKAWGQLHRPARRGPVLVILETCMLQLFLH